MKQSFAPCAAYDRFDWMQNLQGNLRLPWSSSFCFFFFNFFFLISPVCLLFGESTFIRYLPIGCGVLKNDLPLTQAEA